MLTGTAIPDASASGGVTAPNDRSPARRRRPAGIDAAAPLTRRTAPELALRWMAVLAGAVLVARSGSSTVPLLWGVPLLALTCLRTAEVLAGRTRGRLVASAVLVAEVGAAALAAGGTGGWHSGWVVTLVALAALGGYRLPERWSGQVASAAVIALFIANLAGGGALPGDWRYSLDLVGLLVVAVLAVSYAAWLARFGDEDRARLAATNDRLMATNDLLVLLEHILLRGEDATDPQQAARAVARLARELLHPDVVVVASLSGMGDAWRILLAEGASMGSVVGELDALERAGAAVRSGAGARPVLLGGESLLSTSSRSGACIPLLVRGELIGALVLESDDPHRWDDRDVEAMTEMGRWAALIVDNARRFNTLWVVGSAEERARVARNLHDNLGQSMAALGLELDWLARVIGQPEHVERIRELRQGVTNMVAELRYNMRDLCCDVSESRTLGDALAQLAQGLESRSSTRIHLDVQAPERLPLALEHQVLQMARILLGAAVDSRADAVDLAWVTGREGGCLEVGYDSSTAAPGAHYESEAPILLAVAEVRDRCWAVGATVECEVGEEGRGRVRCRVAA